MSEVRLINANAAISVFADMGQDIDTHDVIDLLKEQPTVDAVPVVRCKECKYCYAEGFVNVRNVCEKHYDFGNVDDDWFCADGERDESCRTSRF